MNFAYILNADGFKLIHECTYHTTEKIDACTVRRVYPRYHLAAALLDISLIVDEDTENGTYCCKLAIANLGSESVRISQADIGFSHVAGALKLNYFRSDWGSEFSPDVKQITAPFSFGCTSGRACKGYTPYAEFEAGSTVYAMALAWSGNWTCTAIPQEYDSCAGVKNYCCTIGISDGEFYHDIAGGEKFVTPCVYISRADDREDACLALRRHFRAHVSLLRDNPFGKLPVVYNTWWAYEDKEINEDIYARNAQLAKELGCDYAMLDAGWFGDSVDGQTWYEKRGDWDNVNKLLFPSGLKDMCDKAKAIEIVPGIWCEIEAVGRFARLNELHDELLAKRDGASLGYVCFGSKAAREWAMGVVDRILGEYGAKWIKFDFNLDPGFGCNRKDHDHGKGDGLYAHYIGYYQFLDEVRAKYPDSVIENCSSGGLRNDAGMLAHTHYAFLADPDHTEFHLQLYWGALSYLHQSSLYHFTWSETTYCDHNLGIRNPVPSGVALSKVDYIVRAAMLGVPGISYKLPELPAHVSGRIAQLIEFYNRYSSDFIFNGDAYRLTAQPLTCGRGERFPAFEFVSTDKRALIYFFRLPGAAASKQVFPKALEPERIYNVRFEDSLCSYDSKGSEIMQNGICADNIPEEGSEAVIIE